MMEALTTIPTPSLPTRRDEAWRYSDHAALARLWPTLAAPERIAVPAGETHSRIIDTLPASGIVRLDAALGTGARLEIFALVAGADYGRVEISASLATGSHVEIGGAILGTATQTLEIVTSLDHAQPGAASNQTVRSVLGGTATGSFLGKVHVARHAQQTDAEQSVKAMLLDRGATANAVPQLEIYADDVKCAHGATVGELDAMSLFYLAARGIPPHIAKRLMLIAFLADAFAEAGDAREMLEARAVALLEAML
jgi:Fe-S cluster assembly protein SufD